MTVPEVPPAGVHTPAEAIAAGLCPGCLGTGRVHVVLLGSVPLLHVRGGRDVAAAG